MVSTKFKGQQVSLKGTFPEVSTKAPAFTLVAGDLSEKSVTDFAGKKVVLSINPSFDTGVCQATARQFNTKVGGQGDVVVLMVSADLPFAQKRFCEAEGLEHVTALSSFRSTFGADYGVELADGPLQGLTARAVVVIDGDGIVRYAELVPEITSEPNYSAALAALK